MVQDLLGGHQGEIRSGLKDLVDQSDVNHICNLASHIEVL